MVHFVKFTVATGTNVSPHEVQRWLLHAMLKGAQSMPFQIGNVSAPEVRCDEYVEPSQEQVEESIINSFNLHPSIVAQLRQSDGTLRAPFYEEWNEDFGLGYANRKAWERERGEY